MGRTFPIGENTTIHPLISTSFFFVACITATFAIISSLCGALSRKKPQPTDVKENKDPNQPPAAGSPEKGTPTTPSPPNAELDNRIDVVSPPQNDVELSQHPLPPPPGRRHLSGAASYHFRSESASSSHGTSSNLPSSLSMRVMGNGLSSRQGSKREDVEKTKKKKEKHLKHEDSIWKKTIILGDKCRVPDEDDEDAIVYDEKGNRISTYHHRKNANSLALSRQSSAIDQDAIPSKRYPESE